MANSPCKIHKSIFKRIDTICMAFLWNARPPRVALKMLRLPTHLTGSAFPKLYLYYLASQLVHNHDCLHPIAENTCTTTKGAIASSLETLHNVINRGHVLARLGTSMLCTAPSLFKSVVTKISKDSWSTYTINPLWFSPNLQEQYSLPDPQQCYSKGNKYLCHLYTAQGFKSNYQL